MKLKEAAKRYVILLCVAIFAIGTGIAFWTGVFAIFGIAQAKPAPAANKWELLAEYEIEKGEKIKALSFSNGERTDIVYVTKIHWGEKTLGHVPAISPHQSDTCPPKEK